jgi:hypothetical protein
MEPAQRFEIIFGQSCGLLDALIRAHGSAAWIGCGWSTLQSCRKSTLANANATSLMIEEKGASLIPSESQAQ